LAAFFFAFISHSFRPIKTTSRPTSTQAQMGTLKPDSSGGGSVLLAVAAGLLVPEAAEPAGLTVVEAGPVVLVAFAVLTVVAGLAVVAVAEVVAVGAATDVAANAAGLAAAVAVAVARAGEAGAGVGTGAAAGARKAEGISVALSFVSTIRPSG
jgi:hypothetical protein